MSSAYRKVPAGQFVSGCVDRERDSERCHRVSSATPQAFGPASWWFMHTTAENYDDTQPDAQKRCAAWLSNSPAMLPCPECRGHMQAYVDEHPAADACLSRATLRTYLVDLHNTVNERTGSGEPVWTPEQASERYATVELCID